MPDRNLDWVWEQCARTLTAIMNFVLWIASFFR
jgi:hypothetical protein